MTYSSTDRKVYKLLINIYEQFKQESRYSLVAICKKHKLASEYSAFLIEMDRLKIIRSGKCGPATRKWVGPKPTLSLANELVDKYNAVRKVQIKKAKKTIPNKSIYNQLISIGNQLQGIQNYLSRPQ